MLKTKIWLERTLGNVEKTVSHRRKVSMSRSIVHELINLSWCIFTRLNEAALAPLLGGSEKQYLFCFLK